MLEVVAVPDGQRSAGRQGFFGSEDEEPRPVIGFVGLAVERPFDRGRGPRGDGKLGVGVVPVVHERVGAGNRGGARRRVEFDVELHVGDRRHPEVGPRRDVAPPVVLARLLGVGSLVAGPAAEEEQRGQEDRWNGEGQEPEAAPQQGPRPQTVEDPGGVELLPAEPHRRQRQEQRDQAEVEQAVQGQSPAVQREGAHVAPRGHRVPRQPVGDPGERRPLDLESGQRHPVNGVDHDGQPESVHGVAVAEEREGGGHEGRPEDEGGDHHPAPGRGEGPQVEPDRIAEEVPSGDDRPRRDQGGAENHSRHHDVAHGLPEQHRSGPDGSRPVDLGESLGPLLHERLHGVEEEQNADKEAQRVELAGGHGARSHQERRIEGAEREQARGNGLPHNERDEQIEPRPHQQLPDLDPADGFRCREESRRDGPHSQFAERPADGGPRLRGFRWPGPLSSTAAEADHQGIGVALQEPAGGVPGRGPHRQESDTGKANAAEQESRVRRERRRVVEVHAPIDLQEGLVQPPKARGIHEHQRPVDGRVEPARRPGDQESQHGDHHRDGKRIDHDGPARPGAEEERHPGEEHDLGKAEQQGRVEIVAGNERPDVRGVRSRRQDVVETGGQSQVETPDDEERRQRSGEAAPHVLPGGQARPVDDLPHPEFRVPDQHEARPDGQEPDTHGRDQDRLEHALGGDGGDVRTESSRRRFAAADGHVALGEAEGGESENAEQEPVGRAPERRGQFAAGDGGPPRERGHDAACGAASGAGRPFFGARFRMRSR